MRYLRFIFQATCATPEVAPGLLITRPYPYLSYLSYLFFCNFFIKYVRGRPRFTCAVVRESLRGRPRLLFARSSASLCAVIRDNSRCAAVRDILARSSAIWHPCPCAAIRDYCQCAVVRDILARPSAILHMCPRAVIRDYSLGARLLRGHPRFCSVSQQTRPSIFMCSMDMPP